MGTAFTEIYDLFLISVEDYELKRLYENSAPSYADFYTYLEGFVVKAVPRFTNCKQSLSYTNATFSSTLTIQEIDILTQLMLIEWFDRKIQDVNQFQLHLSDTDFKLKSEAENLKQKSAYRDGLREKVSQSMVDYGLLSNNWSDWSVGNYGF